VLAPEVLQLVQPVELAELAFAPEQLVFALARLALYRYFYHHLNAQHQHDQQ
jgi:hypothetical protein